MRQNGTLACWGRNASGQLGDGTTAGRALPVLALPANVNDWKSVAAHGDTTCALRATGALHCWGANGSGQVGTGATSAAVSTPSPVDGGPWATFDVSANHACAVATNGTLWCWGRNANGESGIGSNVNPLLQPTQVGTDTDWARPSLGQGVSTCAIKTGGAMFCWGNGSYGQLGLGNLSSFNAPQAVPSVMPWQAAALGNEHACGLSAGGTLLCWGASYWAQLGSGQPFTATPTRVVDPE